MKSIKRILSAALVFLITLSTIGVGKSHASEENIGTLKQATTSSFNLSVKDEVKGSIDEQGILTLTDGNKSVKMPSSTKDKDGKDVNLYYEKAEDNSYNILVIKSTSDRGVGKCVLGTVGGAGTGGLAGAAAGTAVPGLGNVAGAVIGGVSGAATGAAASCFD